MADQELLVVVRMRDEASAALKQATAGMRSFGLAHEAARKVSSFRTVLQAANAIAVGFNQTNRTVAAGLAALGPALSTSTAGMKALTEAGDKAKTTLREVADRMAGYQKAKPRAESKKSSSWKIDFGAAAQKLAGGAARYVFREAIEQTEEYKKALEQLDTALKSSGGSSGFVSPSRS